MKYIFIIILFVIIVGFPVCGNEQEDLVPVSSVSILLVDSIAFIGVAYESFSKHTGIGFTCGLFFMGDFFVVEPGVFTRYYLGDISSSVYILGSATVLSALGSGGSELLYNLNTGLGFNAIFGEKKNIRMCVELGPRLSGVLGTDYTIIIPHVQLMFGSVKNK